jgi:nitronate monooxygenase
LSVGEPLSVLDELSVPIVLAPLAGGPATVELAVAVSEAGGLGFLAAGYKTAGAVRRDIADFRARSNGPFGVNVFTPPSAPADPVACARYRERLEREAARTGAALGAPRFDDDQFDAKIGLLLEVRPPVVSFVFGCPAAEVIGGLRDVGCFVLVTVTTPEEAAQAAGAGADGLVVQGYEAGGHRGSGVNDDQPAYGLISLLQLVRAAVTVPLVAAGGLSSGRGLAAALAAGASAGQIGTAFLLCPEAGTAPVQREAIASAAPTSMTRAFTGKPARGIVNRFMREHDGYAPAAYPEVHHLTAPIRAAARRSGDPDQVNLWAGQSHQLARAEPAAQVVARLAREAREALGAATGRF